MTNPQEGAEPDYKVARPKPTMTRKQKLGMGALLAAASLAALWTVWFLQPRHPRCGNLRRRGILMRRAARPSERLEPGPEAKPSGDGFSDIEGNWPHSGKTSKRGTPHST